MPTQTPTPAVEALNIAREQAVKSGQGAYGGSRKSLATFDTPQLPTTITSASVTPSAPINITQPAPATQAAGLQGYIAQNADAFTQQQAADAESAKVQEQNSFDAFMKGVMGTEGQVQLTNKAYANTVDPAKKELNDINNQILAEQVAARHQIEALQRSNPNGLGAEAIQQKVNDIQRDSIAKQADLSVIQMAKQGNYTAAKEIADRAVSAILEQEKNRNEALQLSYERNKSLFDKSEQRLFETAQADRNRDLEFKQYKLKAQFDEKIRQADPAYQLDLQLKRASIANTYSEISARNAAGGGGGTGSAFINQQGFKALNSTQQTAATKINDYYNALTNYRALYDKTVGSSGVLVAGADAATLQSAANSLMFTAAQAEGTGALQAADRKVLEGVISNPTNGLGAIGTFLRGGKKGGLSALDTQLNKTKSNLTATYGLEPVTAAPSDDPLGLGI